MAIEQRALFALSIAFTASIVAYPDLPPDIPPRAGREGAFVGAPLVAFLLPLAALAIWWVLARLDPEGRPGSPSRRVGAATALFLAAFHVTMLIAFIGVQLWLGRVLAGLVGLFLISTGNDLPRLRPNPVWGIRIAQTLQRDDVWRRVHRIGGYIRVAMGAAVCLAAVLGWRWLAELIVAAVVAETMACVGASFILSRRKAAVAAAMLIGCGPAAADANAGRLPPENIASLSAFIDATVPALMEQHHVAGTAIVVVHHGRVTSLRGFGKSRLAPDIPVDASRTPFRIGSVTKIFTAAAAMQLAEAGRLDLHRDVREYLPDIPLRYATSTHHLLTHTAGLLERLAGRDTDRPEHLQPLSIHLRHFTPEQVRSPGYGYSYSNYHYALTGLIVERISGVTYEEYLAERILRPLRMTSTTARQPAEPRVAGGVAHGYRWNGRQHDLVPYGFMQPRPAGSMVASAADVGRFMMAILDDGSVDGGRILRPQTVRAMLAVQFTPDARMPGEGYGFSHFVSHGQRLVVRGGTAGNQASLMVLAPADRLGIFVASNSLPGLGDFLFGPMMTHLAGAPVPALPPRPLPGAKQRAARFAGSYRDYHRTHNELSQAFALMPMIQSRVSVEADGAIRWRGTRWLEIEPLVFRSESTDEHIRFREDEHGVITELLAAGSTHERVGWAQQNLFHLALLLSCVVAFAGYLAVSGIRAVRGRAAPGNGLARACATAVAVTNLVAVLVIGMNIKELAAVTPLPTRFFVLLSLPLLSLALTAVLPALAVRAWWERSWTRGERIAYSVFALCAVAFMTFLNYWRLLGVRY